ncbi:phosphotransferase family protein [Rhodococcus sp. 14-2470-1a]|uniref:phosphotransferase family protein n=1 Tax=Rhodococcus sp. 14-2470-1a TaxID=2023150 RepID=UPI000B9B0013|nr:phosphotransferase family protein [Rhodococcus sp. 14-2470-1a]OZF45788.1 phosphotransferase family protein [Rhodococcus sp. 14-2470-1a]
MPHVDNNDLLEDLTARAFQSARNWRNDVEITDIASLTGGSSSLTFVAHTISSTGSEPVVLKVAPPGLAPIRNRDVLRQGRVMAALQGAPGVAAPAVYFEDAGSPPDVPPFVAMQMVAGECVEPLLDTTRTRDADCREQTHARYLDATRMLANLHRLDPSSIGLGDEPAVPLSEEIDRWTRAFETVPADLAGEYLSCAKALHATIPKALPPVVNHGDFRLGNTLCDGHRVTAIIDWEIWSVGDPRVDLTWLTYFTDEAKHPAAPPIGPAGTPTVHDVVRTYEDTLGRSVADIAWFNALTRYKEAAATGLLIKRARRAGTMTVESNPSFVRMEPKMPTLLSDARALIGY